MPRVARMERATEDHAVSNSEDWRARRWEDTHQRIYDTALRLFQEQGFEQVSVGQIVSGVGVRAGSGPTMYYGRTGRGRRRWRTTG